MTAIFGDIIGSLPTARQLGGGRYIISLRDPERPGGPTRDSMAGARYEAILPLLSAQPYVTGVEWLDHPSEFTHDFRVFRQKYIHGESLAHWQARSLGVCISTDPWLTVDAIPHGRVVIARTERYRNPRFPWAKIVAKHPEALFVGLPHEHSAFCAEFGTKIEHAQTEDLLEMAVIIAGATEFFGNQSCAWWIAYGIGIKTTQESFIHAPNSMIPRENARYTLTNGEIQNLLKSL